MDTSHKKIKISPALRRDLIEKANKHKQVKEHVIDGINDPDDRFFGIAIKSIIDETKKKSQDSK